MGIGQRLRESEEGKNIENKEAKNGYVTKICKNVQEG